MNDVREMSNQWCQIDFFLAYLKYIYDHGLAEGVKEEGEIGRGHALPLGGLVPRVGRLGAWEREWLPFRPHNSRSSMHR